MTLVKWGHNGGDKELTVLFGAYSSKEAAVAASSGEVDKEYGILDVAIEDDDLFKEKGDRLDNRSDPPDDGVLLLIGGRGVVDGKYIRLDICKMPVLGMPSAAKKSQNEKRK